MSGKSEVGIPEALGGCFAILLVLVLNGLILAGGVWVIVMVLRWTGVIA